MNLSTRCVEILRRVVNSRRRSLNSWSRKTGKACELEPAMEFEIKWGTCTSRKSPNLHPGIGVTIHRITRNRNDELEVPRMQPCQDDFLKAFPLPESPANRQLWLRNVATFALSRLHGFLPNLLPGCTNHTTFTWHRKTSPGNSTGPHLAPQQRSPVVERTDHTRVLRNQYLLAYGQ